MSNTHGGHRARMKQRFLEHGLDNFNDLNVLELLLFYAQPRRDTNELAHALMERFGSLSAVLESSPSELKSVSGIGDSAVGLLSLIPAVSRRYMVEKTPESEPVNDAATAGRYFIPRFMYETGEVVLALMLDARNHPIACLELSRGVVNAAEISARKLAEMCLEHRASSVILAHNHLSGVAFPSVEDDLCTRQLQRALQLIGVDLRDHVIVAGCEYLSMRESGMLR